MSILWDSLGLITALNGCIIANTYEAISHEQVHPLVQILVPHDVSTFQSDYTHKQLSTFKMVFVNTMENLSYIISCIVQTMYCKTAFSALTNELWGVSLILSTHIWRGRKNKNSKDKTKTTHGRLCTHQEQAHSNTVYTVCQLCLLQLKMTRT